MGGTVLENGRSLLLEDAGLGDKEIEEHIQ